MANLHDHYLGTRNYLLVIFLAVLLLSKKFFEMMRNYILRSNAGDSNSSHSHFLEYAHRINVYHSYDTAADEPAFNVEYFAADLCLRLKTIQEQDKEGRERQVAGSEYRRHMILTTPDQKDHTFHFRFIEIPLEEWNPAEAARLKEEQNQQLNDIPIDSEARISSGIPLDCDAGGSRRKSAERLSDFPTPRRHSPSKSPEPITLPLPSLLGFRAVTSGCEATNGVSKRRLRSPAATLAEENVRFEKPMEEHDSESSKRK